ncbi:MAG: hypothetical protein H7Y31_16345 [Chitinophagaceae bacterium]|nr:hypothetical protein [Chitinophagaceae bacterium]
MQANLIPAFMLFMLISCQPLFAQQYGRRSAANPYPDIQSLPLPPGYTRVQVPNSSFAAWLRTVRLKTDRIVYLYDGKMKPRQDAQFAVLDISVGNKDLQQCADAIMRLRAEYLLSQKRWKEISFRDNVKGVYQCPSAPGRKTFEQYLEKVYAMCGTLSLEKQLYPRLMGSIQGGDVFIKGGSPGHAAIVMDVATNSKGDTAFLLANGFMPAQDIHIVLNPGEPGISPWFRTSKMEVIRLPEWKFMPNQLRRW